jgi:hypothetical protein
VTRRRPARPRATSATTSPTTTSRSDSRSPAAFRRGRHRCKTCGPGEGSFLTPDGAATQQGTGG